MSAYAIFIRERTRNAGELQTYAEMVTSLLGGTNATVLAAYGPKDVLEESIKICGVAWPALRKAGRLELVSH